MVDTEIILSWVLRIGVFAGAILMTLGFFVGANVILLGVFVLALTPFVRVLMAGLCFLSQRNLVYFIIGLYVISVLVMGTLLRL